MASQILDDLGTATAMTISLASLASGSAKQSDMVSNATPARPRALVVVKITSGSTGPTLGAVYEVYLLRGDGSGNRDDNAGASDATIAIENAPLLGTIVVTNTANKAFQRTFDTGRIGPLGVEWGIAVKNSSGQTLHATAGNHHVRYTYVTPSLQ